MDIQIASKIDLFIIRDLAYDIWPKVYKKILSVAQINYMLQNMYSIDVLTEQMNDGHKFLLLKESNNNIGFCSYSPLEISLNSYKLHKIYIDVKYHGLGFGRLALNYIINDLISIGGSTLFLNVNRQNSAKMFYEKIGFVVVDEVDIEIGNSYFMNDYIMKLQLSK